MPSLILHLKDRELQRLPITKTVISIGRDSTNDLVIDNPSVSRQHALVQYHSTGFVISDQESANGLLVNGEKVQSTRLSDGMSVNIGKFSLRFVEREGPPVHELSVVRDVAQSKEGFDVVETTHLQVEDIQKLLRHDVAAAIAPQPANPEHSGRLRNFLLILFGSLIGVAIYHVLR